MQSAARLRLVRCAATHLNRAMQRWGPWRFRLEGQTVYATTIDRIAVILMHRLGSAERFELDVWRQLCTPGSVILDVGSNLGVFAFVAAEAVGSKGRVLAFEADPLNCELLRLAREHNGYDQVEVIEAAVTDLVGTVRFAVREDHRGDSHIAGADSPFTTVEVAATTLDAALGEDPRVDVIKFDIQGAEARAIQGMDRLMAASPRLKVLSEFWPEGIERGGGRPRLTLQRWREWGFQLSYIDERQARLVPVSEDELLQIAHRERYVNVFMSRDE